MIHLLHGPATPEQVEEMLEELETYIKLAVDIRRRAAAGGGRLHADCETILLDDGSRQADIWGADWVPRHGRVRFEALINLRPTQGNPSVEILDAAIRDEVESVVRELFQRP
jgi:hypothetical protein